MKEETLMSIFDAEEVRAALANSAAFRLSLRFLSGSVLLKADDSRYLLEIADGKLVDFRRDDAANDADVKFEGSVDSWRRLLQPNPPPGCQGMLYNDGRSGVRYNGDIVTALGPLAQVIREFEKILKSVIRKEETVDDLLPEVDREFDAAVGRYMYVRVQGVQYRVYYEQSGFGSVPLLLQHTAGADSRQARHILEDPDFQRHFRIISYDMPFHGRSLPPTSHRWWDEKFKVTKSFLVELILAISGRLKLDRPVFMGSAMGGILALDLAHQHSDKFRAVIALNAGLPVPFDDATLTQMGTFSHPNIGHQWVSTIIAANIASTSPEIYRRELEWTASQVAPGVPEGALHYYVHDYGLTPDQLAAIDTDKVAVYLFTGDDDFMGTDFGTDRLVQVSSAFPYKKLRRLGHYGFAENPHALKDDIWPTIEEILARSGRSREESK
jgi:pimeloyl-ACP methyl ester carboxylesterase